MSYDHRIKHAAPAESDLEWTHLLSAAYAPSALDETVNAQLVEQALRTVYRVRNAPTSDSSASDGDTLAAIGDRERAQADELRAALDGQCDHPLIELVDALQVAYNPTKLASDSAAADVESALRAASRVSVLPRRVWTYGIGVLAMAAGISLWFSTQGTSPSSPGLRDASQLAQSRSLSPLFTHAMEQHTPSQRMDRIYAVRSKELRYNRFAAWRVR